MITADQWAPASGMDLEPNADTAVREIIRNTAVTAGPGAGKTELLAQRADFLMRTGACRYPQRILAISFKVDAARNLARRVSERCGPNLAARLDSHTFHAFAKGVIDRNRAVLTGINALDPDYTVAAARVQHRTIHFDDFLPLALTIAEQEPIVRAAVRQTYTHVFLDEFQDCTANQYALIRYLFGGGQARLTAVGDTKQRIMRFAGALEGIYARYAADFDAQPLNLYQNYRSQPVLRRMQNRMVAVMEPSAAVLAASIEGDGGDINTVEASDEFEEARRVREIVVDALDEGTPHAEIAVLVAKELHLYTAALKAELDAHAVSYRDEANDQDVFAEPVTRLVYDLLTVVITRHQPDAYRRLLASTERLAGIGADTENLLARLTEYLRDVSARIDSGEIDCSRMVSVQGIIDGYITLVGIDALRGWLPEYGYGTRVTDLITAGLIHYQHNLDAGCSPAQALRRLADTDAIRLLTVHKAKGLEFELVIFLAVEEETFWAQLDEERAVFFVGISRAKHRLTLTTARTRTRPTALPPWRQWDEQRTPHEEFISYIND
jgi:superfamily I DNA/RNA helicase